MTHVFWNEHQYIQNKTSKKETRLCISKILCILEKKTRQNTTLWHQPARVARGFTRPSVLYSIAVHGLVHVEAWRNGSSSSAFSFCVNNLRGLRLRPSRKSSLSKSWTESQMTLTVENRGRWCLWQPPAEAAPRLYWDCCCDHHSHEAVRYWKNRSELYWRLNTASVVPRNNL